MKWFSWLSLSFLLLAACGGTGGTEEVSSPEPQSTATYTPTATQTSSPTPTITPSPTTTPTPTATSTPTPTATPIGFYASSEGYSIILPPDFEYADNDNGVDSFYPPDEELILTVSCDYSLADVPPDEVMSMMSDLWGEIIGEIEVISSEEVALGDGTGALWEIYETQDMYPPLSLHFILAPHETKPCLFFVAGNKDRISDIMTEINRMTKSIVLAPPEIMGVERAGALVLIGRDPLVKDLDPALQDGSADDYVGHLFSGLVRLNSDIQIEPDLAESWEISVDGTEYIFTLRENLRFQSGKPLTAEDIRYSWERAADPETGSITADSYLGDIVGVREKLNGEAQEISGIEVIDDLTLKVTLAEAKPFFLAKLSYPTSFIVDKENVETGGEDWAFLPNASGPFGLKNYVEEEGIVFERNPKYHTPADLDYVVYRINPPGSRLSIFEAGDVDIARIGPYDAQEIQDPSHPLSDQLHTTTSMCTSMILLNNSIPPMDDPLIREAFVRSIDRDLLNENFSNNMELPAFTILPPAMPGYTNETSIAAYDPQAARAALEASTYSDTLPEIAFTIWGYGDEEDPYTDAIINMWRENLGVEVEVEYLDPDYFTEAALSNENQLVDYGWCADYPDPENFLDLLFHSQGGFNVTGYSNSKADTLLDQARAEQDPATRLSLYQQIEQILLNDFAALPIGHSRMYSLADLKVEGYVLTPMGIPIIHLLSLQSGQ